LDQNYDDQQVLVDNPSQFDPKVANALATITRDRSHQIIAAQSKLDRRYKSLSAVAYLARQHFPYRIYLVCYNITTW